MYASINIANDQTSHPRITPNGLHYEVSVRDHAGNWVQATLNVAQMQELAERIITATAQHNNAAASVARLINNLQIDPDEIDRLMNRPVHIFNQDGGPAR